MKWIIEINDTPENKDYPITGYQECSNGVKEALTYLQWRIY